MPRPARMVVPGDAQEPVMRPTRKRVSPANGPFKHTPDPTPTVCTRPSVAYPAAHNPQQGRHPLVG
jgi:hypothetical protein